MPMPFSRIHETFVPAPALRPEDVPAEAYRPVAPDPQCPAMAIRTDAPVGGDGWCLETSAGRPSWPPDYALAAMPSDYQTTASPGVFVDRNCAMMFILQDGNAYRVVYDNDNATYRVASANDRSRPTYAVRRDGQSGRWARHDAVRESRAPPAPRG
jgi:hypothetical protein